MLMSSDVLPIGAGTRRVTTASDPRRRLLHHFGTLPLEEYELTTATSSEAVRPRSALVAVGDSTMRDRSRSPRRGDTSSDVRPRSVSVPIGAFTGINRSHGDESSTHRLVPTEPSDLPPWFMPSPAEPSYPPIRELMLYSCGKHSWFNGPRVTTVEIELRDFHDSHYDWPLTRHVGFHIEIQMGLLGELRFWQILARAVTLTWSVPRARIICRCSRGRHRSVAAVSLLRKLYSMLNSDIRISAAHRESYNWRESTCSGQCSVCARDPVSSATRQYLREIIDMLPYAQNVAEVIQW